MSAQLVPQVLRQTAAFQLLDDDELAELTAHVDERTFATGQAIFQAGEPGGAMHVEARVVVAAQGPLARVDAHPDAHRDALRPGLGRERALGRHGAP